MSSREIESGPTDKIKGTLYFWRNLEIYIFYSDL